MQTIILFSDHSEQAHRAAEYALHLAKKIEANVLISDAVMQPTEAFAGSGGPINGLDWTRKKQLTKYCNKLRAEQTKSAINDKFTPDIYGHSEQVDIAYAIEEFERCLDVAYIILPCNIYYGASSILPVKNLEAILHTATAPVILVPEAAPIRYAEKYAFVNDISHNNLPFLNRLVKLAAISAAELMLVSINNGRPLDDDQEEALYEIMKEAINKVDYGRIYYRHTPNSVAKTDLEWLFEDNKFEALAMVYNKTGIYKKLLADSVDEQIKGSVNVPLIIYPA